MKTLNRSILLFAGLLVAFGIFYGHASGLNSHAHDGEARRASIAYLDAEYRALKASSTAEHKTSTTIDGYIDRETSGCNHLGQRSPSVPAGITGILVDVVVVAIAQAERNVYRHFAQEVSSLRWSRIAITQRVRQLVHHYQRFTTITVPALCSNLKVWSKSNFASEPTAFQHFSREMRQMPEEPYMAPYLLPGIRQQTDGTLVHIIQREREVVAHRVASVVQNAVMRLDERLDLAGARF